MELYSLILAAGEGKRMKSKIAKPLQPAAGKALVEWVLDAAEGAGIKRNVVIIGHKAEDMKDYLKDRVQYAYQYEQLGTGHAVMQGMTAISEEEGTVVVLSGDSPLMTAETLRTCIKVHEEEGCAATVITTVVDDPFGYGRIVRKEGEICRIVEQKDTNEEEKQICEINSGMYCFDLKKLHSALKRLTNENAQGEYYITDVIEILLGDGEKVGTYQTALEETLGVNDKVQLAAVDAILNRRLVKQAMLEGVTVVDPATTRIGAGVKIGCDTVIQPNTILEGKTVIGEDCEIGPNTRLTNCVIGNNTEVAFSVGIESKIGDRTHVGPFAYLRPNTVVGDEIKVGDFVELKNATIGNGTKIAHLTYVGDAQVGERVNFGCGTVVVNYDGVHKHKTIIEDDCFIGCNSNLVSPVTIKKGAYTAAGSTITDMVPEGALAIARSRQVNKESWTGKKRKQKED